MRNGTRCRYVSKVADSNLRARLSLPGVCVQVQIEVNGSDGSGPALSRENGVRRFTVLRRNNDWSGRSRIIVHRAA